jgi:hypothetical protein
MPDRPLLILPAPTAPGRRRNKGGGSGPTHLPTRQRQGERLNPRFQSLQQAFDARRARLQVEPGGLAPEDVVVLETVGAVADFMSAVRSIPGLEWLGEMEEDEIPPDDDFFIADRTGAPRPDKTLRGRLFLIFTNQRALRQMVVLWETWRADGVLPFGLGRWNELFSKLRDVRPWSVRDRLFETGILDDWRERVEHNTEVVPCEIELWFRGDPHRRQAARDRVESLVRGLQGEVVQEAAIEEIAYHALLARLPIASVQALLANVEADAALVQCEQVQFFRASGQMAGVIVDDEHLPDPTPLVREPGADLGEPVVALFDGFPLQNHQRLAGRLFVDDPDGYEADYPAGDRRHGTAMASLIAHGDIDAGEMPLRRRVYVRPILRPDTRDWHVPRWENVSESVLVVDLLHRSVRRLFEGDGRQPATAPNTAVISLSIGILDRSFDGALSPLARLLDWLAWRYRVLFVVSAGNRQHDIELEVSTEGLAVVSPQNLQIQVLKAVARDARNRRLISPSEAINVLTVGALHGDASNDALPPNTIGPFVAQALPSPINAQGMGYRRAIKPDVLMPGGRIVLRPRLPAADRARLQVLGLTRSPGQRVASPGAAPGDLSGTWYLRGTSNAAALTSRLGSELYDVLEELRAEDGGEAIDSLPRSVWLKALLVHGASWGEAGQLCDAILRTPQNSRQFKEYITRLLGYGAIDPSRVRECARHRVTVLGGGLLQADQAHIHRIPLPPALSGQRVWRRLTVTLAWLTPIHAAHQAWRRADLWFNPAADTLRVQRREADWHAVQRGTVQHEIFEGESALAFVDGTHVEVHVNCRRDAGDVEDSVPYALVTTLEIDEQTGIDIYSEIRTRVQAARVRIIP